MMRLSAFFAITASSSAALLVNSSPLRTSSSAPPAVLMMSDGTEPDGLKRAPQTPEERRLREMRMASRITPVNPRKTKKRTERKKANVGRGFGVKGGLLFDRSPGADKPCACGKGPTYAECCQKYHEAMEVTGPPSELVNARYTAFCYRMPDFLMATTDPHGAEYQPDEGRWKKDLLQFMDTLEFQKLTVESEEVGTGVEDGSATVTFRATYVPKRSLSITDAVETSKFVRSEGRWLYSSGVVKYETPK